MKLLENDLDIKLEIKNSQNKFKPEIEIVKRVGIQVSLLIILNTILYNILYKMGEYPLEPLKIFSSLLATKFCMDDYVNINALMEDNLSLVREANKKLEELKDNINANMGTDLTSRDIINSYKIEEIEYVRELSNHVIRVDKTDYYTLDKKGTLVALREIKREIYNKAYSNIYLLDSEELEDKENIRKKLL